jgi:thymidylate synthase (FAD)
MKVELVDHMGTDLSVVNAARVSFNKVATELEEKDERLIKYLARHKHWTPFGHTSVSLRIRAPIFVARQLGKHQVGLVWNEVSRRYVDDEPEFFQPECWRTRPEESIKQGSGDETIPLEDIAVGYRYDWDYEALMWLCKSYYEECIAKGVAPEQARMVLPQSMMTEWIWTGNLVSFSNLCKLRLDSHTQKETRDVAQLVNDIIEPLFPISWKELMKE